VAAPLTLFIGWPACVAGAQNLAAVPTMIWRQKMAIADLRSKVNALRGNADGVRATVDRLQSSYPSPYGQLPWTSTECVRVRGGTPMTKCIALMLALRPPRVHCVAARFYRQLIEQMETRVRDYARQIEVRCRPAPPARC